MQRFTTGIAAALAAGLALACARPHAGAPALPAAAACRAAVSVDGGSSRAIDWILPADDEDRPMLDEWCRAVGPVVVSRGLPHEALPGIDDLVVVSWNVEVGGGDIETLLDYLRDESHPNRQIVVLLQEAYRGGSLVPPTARRASVPRRIAPTPPSGARASVVDIAERRGLFLFYAPSMRNGSGEAPTPAEDRGNAILSTLPLADLAAIELPFEHQRRVAVAATVDVVDRSGTLSRVRLVSAHLDARSSWRRGAFFWFGRLRQAAALMKGIARLDRNASASASSHASPPTILGGDFNSWLGELEPDVRLARSRFPQTPPSPAHVTFPLVGAIGVHLDHLFFSLPDGWRAAVSRLPQRWGSDHYPIAARLGQDPS